MALENHVKKSWQEPSLEVLEVKLTMEGKGTKIIDIVTPSDSDIYDPS
ncbi:paeninodin family lasso peptide [Paenibacillus sepulcri]|uniref:Paeninodin family lasso peptide n=1 Tax=Paenibacillus sepulcri TaxID=359917 RepID=A0ABS7BV49_9BACL|nr:paeninodin family lasso peptide [Paenibacillus sepulcri]